jgi:hypothetical protein
MRDWSASKNTQWATGSHLQARSEVVAVAADDSACEKSLQGVAQSRHVLVRAIGSPRALGIAAYRFQIRAGDLCKLEMPHRSEKRASICSSVSSCITLLAAASS